MHIISGKARGIPLKIPKTHSVRPASQKVKEAVFDILVHTWSPMEGLKVLDLFAGSGSLGIEALSRGASSATFVEQSPAVAQIIKDNLEKIAFTSQAAVLKIKLPWGLKTGSQESLSHLRPHSFNLIFIDPPYDKGLLMPTIRRVAKEKLLAAKGMIVVEHSPREKIHEGALGEMSFQLADQRQYGQTWISFLTHD